MSTKYRKLHLELKRASVARELFVQAKYPRERARLRAAMYAIDRQLQREAGR